jgi:tetratricopeptide (TPR) repeat protein
MKLKIFVVLLVFLLGMGALLAGLCQAQETGVPITTSSNEARDLFVQGRDLYENVEYSAAAKLFDQAIAKDSTFALAYLYRAFCGGGSQVVRTNLAKAQALAAKVSEGERALISYMQASSDANRPKQKEYLGTLLAKFPQDKRMRLYAGWYFQTIGDDKSALDSFKKATEIDSNCAAVYNFIGYVNIAQGNLDVAEKAFKEYIRLRPNKPNPYDSYAELLLKMGRYADSIAQYQKAYDTDNLFIGSLSGIANNYLFKGDFAKAREYYQRYFDKATQVNEKLTAMYNKALSFIYENKPDDAIKAFEERRAFAEKEKQSGAVVNSYVYQGFALSEIGKASEGLKKFEEAISTIDKVDLTPRQKENLKVSSNFWRAYGYALNNQLDKAKASADLFKKDVEARNNPDEMNSLALVFALIDYKSGKYDAAIERLSKQQPDPWGMFYQGQALVKKGDKEAAKALFAKILNWNQNSMSLAVVWNRTHKELGK